MDLHWDYIKILWRNAYDTIALHLAETFWKLLFLLLSPVNTKNFCLLMERHSPVQALHLISVEVVPGEKTEIWGLKFMCNQDLCLYYVRQASFLPPLFLLLFFF